MESQTTIPHLNWTNLRKTLRSLTSIRSSARQVFYRITTSLSRRVRRLTWELYWSKSLLLMRSQRSSFIWRKNLVLPLSTTSLAATWPLESPDQATSPSASSTASWRACSKPSPSWSTLLNRPPWNRSSMPSPRSPSSRDSTIRWEKCQEESRINENI